MAPDTDLCTTSATALMLDVTPDTVRRWVKQGKLTPVRLPSGRMRFKRADIQARITPDASVVNGDDRAAEVSPRASAAHPTSQSA